MLAYNVRFVPAADIRAKAIHRPLATQNRTSVHTSQSSLISGGAFLFSNHLARNRSLMDHMSRGFNCLAVRYAKTAANFCALLRLAAVKPAVVTVRCKRR